MVITESDLHNI